MPPYIITIIVTFVTYLKTLIKFLLFNIFADKQVSNEVLD